MPHKPRTRELIAWPQVRASAFEPTVSVSLGDSPRTVIEGRTNFPDGTVLTLTLYRPESRFVNTVDVTTSHGAFRTGDLSLSHSPMSPGVYRIEITTSGGEQPISVQKILGQNNANLTGPNIKMMVWPTYDLKTTITIKGPVDHDLDAKSKRSSFDREVAGIRQFCKSLSEKYGSDESGCIDKQIKTIPAEANPNFAP